MIQKVEKHVDNPPTKLLTTLIRALSSMTYAQLETLDFYELLKPLETIVQKGTEANRQHVLNFIHTLAYRFVLDVEEGDWNTLLNPIQSTEIYNCLTNLVDTLPFDDPRRIQSSLTLAFLLKHQSFNLDTLTHMIESLIHTLTVPPTSPEALKSLKLSLFAVNCISIFYCLFQIFVLFDSSFHFFPSPQPTQSIL